MHLLDLPVELLDQIFLEAVDDRIFKRVMRLRTVNRQFKALTDEAIYSSRVLDDIAFGQDLRVNQAEYHDSPWSSYLRTYLSRRIYQERNAKTIRGQYRRVAEYLWVAGSKVFSELTLDDCVYDLCGVALFINSSLETSAIVKSTTMEDSFDQNGLTTLFLNAVVYMGLEPFAKALLSDDPNDYWQYPTVAASAKPSLRRLIEIAAFRGHLSLLQHLVYIDQKMLQRDIMSPISASVASSILRYASIGGHIAVMEYALDNSDLLHSHLTTATRQNIEMALSFKHSQNMYRRLSAVLEHGLNPFDESIHNAVYSRLDGAVRSGNLEMVRYHLRQDVCLNQLSAKNNSEPQQKPAPRALPRPLISAIESGNLEILELLLFHGADPNLFPATKTPLMAAAHEGNLEMVKTLVEYGADVNVGTPPPLVVAVQQENDEIFEYLESKGALREPEAGPWAMAYATAMGLDTMIDLLCKYGLDRNDVLHHTISEEEHQYARYLFKDNHYGIGALEFCLPL
ncbi:ankyrin [Xylariaceae sp. FL0255]|nr:ankyrin [Xylariaceae sp. FL0255]